MSLLLVFRQELHFLMVGRAYYETNPTAIRDAPIKGYRLQVSRLQVSGCRFQVSGCRFQVAGCKVTGFRFQVGKAA
jgi:hypothetical protein